MQEKTNQKLPNYVQRMVNKLIAETYGDKIKNIDYKTTHIPSERSISQMNRFSYDLFADIVLKFLTRLLQVMHLELCTMYILLLISRANLQIDSIGDTL